MKVAKLGGQGRVIGEAQGHFGFGRKIQYLHLRVIEDQ